MRMERTRAGITRIAGLFLIAMAAPGAPAAAAEASLTIGACSNLDPASAAEPLRVPVTVKNSSGSALACALECEVLDYWFRPRLLTRALTVEAGATAAVDVEFDLPLRERLFKNRYEAAADLFLFKASVRRGGRTLASAVKPFTFKKRVKEHGLLPPLAGRLSTPRVTLDGVTLEGVEIELDDSP